MGGKKIYRPLIFKDIGGPFVVGSTSNREDGEVLMFVDSRNDSSFLLFKDSGKKIPYPSLPVPVSGFYKCIIGRYNEKEQKSPDLKNRCSNYTVYFFCKDSTLSYIFCSHDSEVRMWQWGKNPYKDVISLKSKHDDGRDILCFLTRYGLFASENKEVTIKSPSYGSRMYERRLLANNEARNSCFLVERDAHGLWYLWEIDVWQPEGENLVSVPNSKCMVVFLSQNYLCSFPLSPKSGLQGNCICFTEAGNYDKFYVFRFADQSLSVFINQPTSGFPVYFPDIRNHFIPCISFVENDLPKISYSGVEQHEMSCDAVNHCNGLHADLVKKILCSIDSPGDYANSREVCREWREIARPICWKPQLDSSFTSPSVRFPWLMLFSENDEYCSSFIDPISNMKYFNYKINEELLGCKIRYSKDGWLLVTRGKNTIFFFEPFSKKRIDLPNYPDIPGGLQADGMSFSSAPESMDWVVVATGSFFNIFYAVYLKFGFENWAFFSATTKGPFISCGCSPLFHDEGFYFLSQTGESAFLNLSNPLQSVFKIITEKSEEFKNDRRGYLVSCNGNLCMVVIAGLLGKFVEVYKWCVDISKWTKLKTLGDFSIFISQTSAFAVRVSDRAQQNKINFPLLAGDRCLSYNLDDMDFEYYDEYNNISDRAQQNKINFPLLAGDRCVSYNLDELNFEYYDGYNSTSSLYKRKEYLSGTWIQPKVIQEYR